MNGEVKLSEKVLYIILALDALCWVGFFLSGLIHWILCGFGVSNVSPIQKTIVAGGEWAFYGALGILAIVGAFSLLYRVARLVYSKRDRELFSDQLRELWRQG